MYIFRQALNGQKSEGQESAFLLKKWRKNGEKNAKNIERSAGSLVLLHNRYDCFAEGILIGCRYIENIF